MTFREEPKISILIATHNRAGLLEQLLQSLDVALALAATPSEVIVVDNASTDATAALLHAWAVEDKRIHLSVATPGKSRALNAALRIARAPLLAFLDDDEQVDSVWLREIVTFFASHPEYAAAVGRVLAAPVDDAELLTRLACYRTIALFDAGDVVREESALRGGNMVLRREVFDRVGNFVEALGPGAVGGSEDEELGSRLRRAGLRIGYMPAVKIYHFIDPARLTQEYFRAFERRTARSRFLADPTCGRRAAPRVVEAAFNFALWSVLGRRIERERARGRLIRHCEILRLRWAQGRGPRPQANEGGPGS